MTASDKPNPGSIEALALGCTCPVLDNAHGKGRAGPNGEREFWVNGGCRVHGDIERVIAARGDEGEGER